MRSASILVAGVIALPTWAQPGPEPKPEGEPKGAALALPNLPASAIVPRNEPKAVDDLKLDQDALRAAVDAGCATILSMQEGLDQSEWPYEGVYRVRGAIPVGYRVGGTAIAALALARAPGYANDEKRQEAVARACAFIGKALDHPLMREDTYTAGYDVRGWGYTYALLLFSELKRASLVPKGHEAACDAAARVCIAAIAATAIPELGGWNYARPQGRDAAAMPSSFMTAATLQALFSARAAGFDVDADVIERALTFLESSRQEKTGEVVYAGPASARRAGGVPGATGRMCIGEATLVMGGRGSVERVRAAVEAFLEHWKDLDARRMKGGTHQPPYGVAPYYFMFAHASAAQAIELLPEAERPALRERCNRLLFSVREDDGTWNDRVFRRSAAYGTAMAIMAMTEPGRAPLAYAPLKPAAPQPATP